MNQETVKLNNLRIAPRKTRLLASTLRGLSALEAEAQLMLRPQRSALPLLKLLRSAIANAKNNKKMDASKLFIKYIAVNSGPMLKRFMPRAMGRATPIQKKTSHIVMTLEEAQKPFSVRFTIIPTVKKEKKVKEKFKKPTPTLKSWGSDRSVGEKKVGFFKRFFSRKSV